MIIKIIAASNILLRCKCALRMKLKRGIFICNVNLIKMHLSVANQT